LSGPDAEATGKRARPAEKSGANPPAADTATPATWTPLALVKWTTDYFSKAEIASPRLDAEVLLAHALGCRRLDLYLQFDRPVEARERTVYRELVQRRARERVPVALLIGEREFWSHSFRVSPDVLIPRPETELLVEQAAKLQPDSVLDFGTGSGNIIVSLALELPQLRGVAVDRSRSALEVARDNLMRHGLDKRIQLLQADRLDGLGTGFDVIVSNPPYIPTADLASLEPELRHEPRLALDGGADGLDVVRPLLAQAPACLRPGGRLLLEIGAGQAAAVVGLAEGLGASASVHRDLAGIERVVCLSFDGGGAC